MRELNGKLEKEKAEAKKAVIREKVSRNVKKLTTARREKKKVRGSDGGLRKNAALNSVAAYRNNSKMTVLYTS